MSLPNKLIVAIHDLHPWGGQDKSNLEILFHLNKSLPMDLHTFSFIDQRPWAQAHHHKYVAPLQRPTFLKMLYYTLASFLRLQRYGTPRKRRSQSFLIQTTGTASAVADVVQVQFIHKTWNQILKDYNIPESESPLKNMYYGLLSAYNILNEEFFYTPNRHYIAVSHSIKKELMEHFDIPAKNIETIYHGVNTEYFYPYTQDPQAHSTRATIRNQLGLKDTDIALLHVGALNQRKGIFNSIKALSHLKKHGVDHVYLLAVGDGDKKELQALAARENVSQELKIISHSKNVRDYYWACDAFFFPSIYEPFGLVILEAMACGLPCVISGHAGATELITHGENGLVLQNILDPESMAIELDALVKDPALRFKLGQAAHASAQKRSWELVAQEYLNYYSKLFDELCE